MRDKASALTGKAMVGVMKSAPGACRRCHDADAVVATRGARILGPLGLARIRSKIGLGLGLGLD